jgi:hypothetical protein
MNTNSISNSVALVLVLTFLAGWSVAIYVQPRASPFSPRGKGRVRGPLASASSSMIGKEKKR